MSEKVFYKVIGVTEGDQSRKSQYKFIHDIELQGYKRCKVRNELYPAAIKSKTGFIIRVALIYGLTIEDFKFLDEFEGDDYKRVEVIVSGPDGVNQIEAELYEWIAGEDLLSIDEEWDLDDSSLEKFLGTF